MTGIAELFHKLFDVVIIGVTDSFFGRNLFYLAISASALLFVLLGKQRFKTGHELFAGYSVLALVLIIYNPVLITALGKLTFFNPTVMARFWLLCPVWIIVAYVLSSGLNEVKKSYIKYPLIIAFAIVLVLTGKSVRILNMLNDPGSIYKIRPEAVEIADEVLMISGNQPVSLLIAVPLTPSGEKFEDGGTIYEGIRQYSGKIDLYQYIYTDEVLSGYYLSDIIPNGRESSEDYMKTFLDYRENEYGMDYVAWPDDDRIISKMEYCGYEIVGHAGGYNIYARS